MDKLPVDDTLAAIAEYEHERDRRRRRAEETCRLSFCPELATRQGWCESHWLSIVRDHGEEGDR